MNRENSKILSFSTGASDPVRHSVLLVDDQEAFRDIARDQLATDSTFLIIGEAVDGANAIELTGRLRPNVIVMDIQMPDMSGIEAARHILRDDPGVRIVLTSMGDDAEYGPLAREIGACGFLPKRELSALSVHALVDDFMPPAGSARMAA
ncbi:MAG: response regulator transcription factor [Chloroflexi bacterium]|nr:response regulator transcription factor [Chloroflexota bacterium]